MILYHGGLEVISRPEIRRPNRTLDYGAGFYTTTSYEQAEKWVLRHKGEDGIACGFVNVYEFDDSIMQKLNCLRFDNPTDEWVDFVYNNRNNIEYHHDYDVVYGPVANDRVYAAFALYENGILNKQELIRELKTYKLVDQMLFHTELSLKYLHFVESKKVLFL